MDKIIKDIFETYVNLDMYQERIHDNPDYVQANENVGLAEDNILKKLEEEYGKGIAESSSNQLFDAYMELSNVYRYHDFSFGFMTGIILGMQMKNPENNEFIQYCKELFDKETNSSF